MWKIASSSQIWVSPQLLVRCTAEILQLLFRFIGEYSQSHAVRYLACIIGQQKRHTALLASRKTRKVVSKSGGTLILLETFSAAR
jgi:hypothetical protein